MPHPTPLDYIALARQGETLVVAFVDRQRRLWVMHQQDSSWKPAALAATQSSTGGLIIANSPELRLLYCQRVDERTRLALVSPTNSEAAEWATQPLDVPEGANVDIAPGSLLVSPNGTSHLLYLAYHISVLCTEARLCYARNNGGLATGWQQEELPMPPNPVLVLPLAYAQALDQHGQPHCVYYVGSTVSAFPSASDPNRNTAQLLYGYRTTTGWRMEEVAPMPALDPTGTRLSLQVDQTGRAHLLGLRQWGSSLLYATRDPRPTTTWRFTTIELASPSKVIAATLLLDPQDQPVVGALTTSERSAAHLALFYPQAEEAGQSELVDTLAIRMTWPRPPALAFDAQGQLHVVYKSFHTETLTHAWREDAENWQRETIWVEDDAPNQPVPGRADRGRGAG